MEWLFSGEYRKLPESQQEVEMFVDVGAVYEGVVSNIDSLRSALADLSRDDTLLYCAKLNALITGMEGREGFKGVCELL